MEQEISRPSFLEVAFSQICEESSRSTCRIQVGAGLWRADKSLIAMAHNGSLPGEPHCEDTGVGCLLINGHCKRCDHAEHENESDRGVESGIGLPVIRKPIDRQNIFEGPDEPGIL